MRIEVLVIGDEVLDGRVVDTNSQRLAHALSEHGLLVAQRTVITDDIDIIVREAKAAAARGCELCVVSGGLGPTTDDLTSEAFAKLAGVPLVRDAAQEERIVAYLQARSRTATENQRAQADRPQGAEVLPNAMGTAPGFALTWGGCRFVSVPGVPREFDHLVEMGVIVPLRVQNRSPRQVRGVYLFGMAEGEADRRLRGLAERFPAVRLQFRVKFPEVHVTLHALPKDGAELEAAYAFVQETLAEAIFSLEPRSFVEAVLHALQSQGASLGIAESCTGGLMTDLITDVPGSSQTLHLGMVAYANAAKVNLLGVEEAVMREHGAVSEAVVRQMATGIRKLSGSTYGVAVSGIAGPGGGSAQKPVGTIWCGLASEEGTEATRVVLPHDRRNNKVVAAYVAFDLLRRHMLKGKAVTSG